MRAREKKNEEGCFSMEKHGRKERTAATTTTALSRQRFFFANSGALVFTLSRAPIPQRTPPATIERRVLSLGGEIGIDNGVEAADLGRRRTRAANDHDDGRQRCRRKKNAPSPSLSLSLFPSIRPTRFSTHSAPSFL